MSTVASQQANYNPDEWGCSFLYHHSHSGHASLWLAASSELEGFLNLWRRLIWQGCEMYPSATLSTGFRLRIASEFFLTIVLHPLLFKRWREAYISGSLQQLVKNSILLESLKWWLSWDRVGKGWLDKGHLQIFLGVGTLYSFTWVVATQMYTYANIRWTGDFWSLVLHVRSLEIPSPS